MCSLEVTCEVLASCGATYANNGTSPITGEKVMSFDTVKNTLQIMYSCGMYDYSGEWACTIGLPGIPFTFCAPHNGSADDLT